MNGAKIYVGNLSWNTNDDTLRNVFSQYGNVLDSIVMRDRETGRSRGFGFVTYATQEEASGAIATANGIDLDGRQIKVNLANARGSGGGGPGGQPGMYPPAGFPQAGAYGFQAPGGYPSGGGPYNTAGFGFQPQQANAGGFPGFGQGQGYPPTQFPPPSQQGGYPGGY